MLRTKNKDFQSHKIKMKNKTYCIHYLQKIADKKFGLGFTKERLQFMLVNIDYQNGFRIGECDCMIESPKFITRVTRTDKLGNQIISFQLNKK
jgi:hypothetical protein